MDITRFIDYMKKDNNLDIHSVMIIKDEKTIFEEYFRPDEKDTPHVMWSVSKSFTSTAIGIAVDMGKISVEDDVFSFFPEYSALCDSDNKRALKVKHLLTMSTGHTIPEELMMEDYNWVKAFLSMPIEHKPGTVFNYYTFATYMLSAIFNRVMGENVHDFLIKGPFAKMGIGETSWGTCPKGITLGGYGLFIKTSDMIKLGQLYLNKGVWQGERIVSEKWINDATSKQIDNASPGASVDWCQGYGYQFWRCAFDAFRADGMNGQYIIVKPEMNLVCAITSHIQDMQIPLTGFAQMIGG